MGKAEEEYADSVIVITEDKSGYSIEITSDGKPKKGDTVLVFYSEIVPYDIYPIQFEKQHGYIVTGQAIAKGG